MMFQKNFHPALLFMKILWVLLFLILFSLLNLCYFMKTFIVSWKFLAMGPSPVSFPLIFDLYGVLFSLVILIISINVLKFSSIYMSDEKFQKRFTYLVISFILSMNMLVFFPNLITLLLGWDGLGITSFLLVIYYQNQKSLGAGMITALLNRLGDVAILLAIGWTCHQGHWLIFSMESMNSVMIFQISCILLAGMTKSAQIPFSSWLPAAMAAPTPVSALVHSSTLVTAGVFLFFRFHKFLYALNLFNMILLFISTMTMLMAAMAAMLETDMKKIIALSTLSQLGMMMYSLAIFQPLICFFHMLTHAIFKALLFICAGNMIIMNSHNQDIRWMGNSNKSMPFITSTMISANLALCGFPFMAGFYSKDLIFEFSSFFKFTPMIMFLVTLATILTSLYSYRLLLFMSWSQNNSAPMIMFYESKMISSSTMTLSTLAIFSGAILTWFEAFSKESLILQSSMKLLPLLIVITGLFFMASLSKFSFKIFMFLSKSMKVSYFISSMWWLTILSSQMILYPTLTTAKKYLNISDQSWTESMTNSLFFSSFSSYSIFVLTIHNNLPMFYFTLTILLLPITLLT